MVPKTITDNAACRGRNTETEFYLSADSIKNVRKFDPLPPDHICFSCPVMLRCREHGLYNEAFGTWGGMKEFELDLERKRLGFLLPQYGTGVIVLKGDPA